MDNFVVIKINACNIIGLFFYYLRQTTHAPARRGTGVSRNQWNWKINGIENFSRKAEAKLGKIYGKPYQSNTDTFLYLNLQNPPDWHEILTYFRGSELQNYFTKLLEDDLKACIKPQYVDQIPRAVKGTVQGMLDRKDELKVQDTIVDQFGKRLWH